MLVGKMVDGVLKRHDGVGLPAGARRPMEDDAISRAVPFGAADLFDLMLDDLVGPDPVKEVDESRIVRLQGKGVSVKRGLTVVGGAYGLAVLLPLFVAPCRTAHGKRHRA